ncbi:MAG: hypothetical protein AAB923_00965 [Patescibacteria group bacterium]
MRHFPTIAKNLEANSIGPGRARIIETDVWSGIIDRYDAVLANPPYLSKSRLSRIEDSVLEHEPPEALFADDDGFALIGRAIVGLPAHLAFRGAAWIEHEPEHAERILKAAAESGLAAKTFTDQYGIMRFSRLRAVA